MKRMRNIIIRKAVIHIALSLFCACGIAVNGSAQGIDPSAQGIAPSVSTDKLDYSPGETANVIGSGFHANETVTLLVSHETGSTETGGGHEAWSVTTDAQGNFSSTWHVDPDDSADSLFKLTADCSDGSHAESLFTDSVAVTTIVRNRSDAGWYQAGFHSPTNNNYYVGGQYRNFFVFDLSGISGPVKRATLRIVNPSGTQGNLTYTLFDVSTPISALTAGGLGLAGIQDDLGTGNSYGCAAISNPNASPISINLNNNGVSAIQGALGSSIAIGGSYPSEYIFGFSGGDPAAVQLVLEIGQVNVLTVGPNQGNHAVDMAFSSGDIQGTVTHISESGFNTLTAAQLLQYDVIWTQWASSSALDVNWAKVSSYVNSGGGFIMDGDAANTNDLSPYVVAGAGSNFPFAITASIPGLTEGLTGDFANAHGGFASWDASIFTPFMQDGVGNAIGLAGRLGNGRMVLTGPDQDFHSQRPSNQYNLLLNEIRWAARLPASITGCGSPVPANMAPTAVADSYATEEDTPLTKTAAEGVLANDTDPENNTLTAVLVSGPSGDPAFTLNSDGSFTYTPNANFNGTDSFVYKANDGQADSNTVTVTITVNAVNDVPILSGVPASATIDELVAYSFTASATDVDNPTDSLVFSLVGAPVGASINPGSGAFGWTPSEVQGPGNYAFSVRVSDGTAYTDTGVSLTVNEVNVAPTLAAIGNQTLDELTLLAVSAVGSDVDDPANALVYSLDTAPTGMTIDSTTGAISWTPAEDQGPGDHPVTVRVTDNGTPVLFGTASFSVHVNEVNSPPVLGAINNQSGYWGNVFGFTATATDPDIPANALTFTLVGAPAGAAIDPSSGAFAWTPTPGQIGMHTFMVIVTDNGVPVLNDTRSVTITVGRRPTMLVYTGDGDEQYSDKQVLTATLTDAGGGVLNGSPLSDKSVGFTIGTQSVSDSTDASGVAATDLILTQDPYPVYTVASSYAGDGLYLASSDTDAFDITKEDARAYYTGGYFVNTSSATSSSATTTLSATIRDITAETVDAAVDPYEGVISNATVSFVIRNGASDTPIASCTNLPVQLVNAGDPKTGTVNCLWNVTISGNSADYTIGIVVNNYYTRNASTDNVVVTVSKPLTTNFITGGGYLVTSSSAGQYAGGAGLKMNFGFNVKYNNSGTNLQGRINVIVRASDGKVYQIKGNQMDTLAVTTVSNNPLVKAATYSGKANLTDITDPLVPISLGGGHSFQMKLTDKGEPGSTDTIGFTLYGNNNGVLLFSSSWSGIATIEEILGGGNLVVR